MAEKKNITYFDANSTTLMPQPVIDSMVNWVNRGNPSSDYASAKEGKKLMESFRKYIATECGFQREGPAGFSIIFTSGASESNNFIVTSATRSYGFKTGLKPHIITSSVEHKSLLECCLRLEKEGLIQLTVVPVGTHGARLGAVAPGDVKRALRPNTCLITIMAANNETGILNDIAAIGAIARAAKIPFHTDAVQMFGKNPLQPNVAMVDAFSVSFHKLHGPAGVGLLVLRNTLIEGYDLCPHICGSQNGGLRGGTEPIHNIAAAFQAFKWTLDGRGEKNARVRKMRDVIREAISRKLPSFYVDTLSALAKENAAHARTKQQSRSSSSDSAPLDEDMPVRPALAEPRELISAAADAMAAADAGGLPVVVWIAPREGADAAAAAAKRAKNVSKRGPHYKEYVGRVLPNTLFLSVHRPGFCNKAARAALEDRGIIVSVGSACNSSTHGPSGVVQAMDVPIGLQDGVLRISLPDDVAVADVQAFVKAFLAVVTSPDCLRADARKSYP